MHADKGVLVYTWRSSVDCEWTGSPQGGNVEFMIPAPRDKVFVVLVREEPEDENGITGSIEKWNWVREDPRLAHAPVDWQQRYGKKLWSRDT